MVEFRYKAFLSYAHEDRQWARWLHRTLEGYRVPGRLVGQHGLHGEIPRRLNPIFRDREDLTAHANLGSRITTAIETSQFLIVICSPHSAASKWVNEEVANFKKVHGEGRILSVIVDGEPFASDRGAPEDECFPPAMRFRVDANGRITDRPIEPLAADVRRTGDGKRRARLKMIAGMVGVELDDLAQRENQRRHRRQSIISAASVTGMIVMGALTWFAFAARDEAQTRQAQAEGLIEFMISDLKDKLVPAGRLELLDAVGRRALDYYSQQRLDALDSDALGRRSRALHLIGEIESSRGKYDAAHKAFLEADSVTAELLQRSPQDTQRIYDHAQSVYWLGYVDLQRGNLDRAEKAFRIYLDFAHQLVLVEPENEKWQMELRYGYSNIGVLLHRQGRFAEAKGWLTKSSDVSMALYKASSGDAILRYYAAQSLAWLADVEEELFHYDQAANYRQNEVDLYLLTLAEDPGNRKVPDALMVARQAIARFSLVRGDLATAERELKVAVDYADDLVLAEPENTNWTQRSIESYAGYAAVLLHQGRLDEARDQAMLGVALSAKLIETDGGIPYWHVLHVVSQNVMARVLARQGRNEEALRVAQRCLKEFAMGSAGSRETSGVRWEEIFLKSVIAQLLASNGQEAKATGLWQQVIRDVHQYSSETSEKGASLLALAYLQTGSADKADEWAARVKEAGYRHPDYTTNLWGDRIIK